MSEAICIYPFSSTYIYCRFSNRKTADRSMKPSSKGMVRPAMNTEDDASRQSLPSARSLMTLGICLIYTTVLFLTAAVVSRLLSTFKTIRKYIFIIIIIISPLFTDNQVEGACRVGARLVCALGKDSYLHTPPPPPHTHTPLKICRDSFKIQYCAPHVCTLGGCLVGLMVARCLST